MSNPILQSAQSSAVVATLRESDTVNPFVYNEKGRIVSPHSMSLLKITKSSGSVGASKTCSFDISKNGLLTGLYLEMTMPSVNVENTDTLDNNLQETAAGATAPASTKTDGFFTMGILGCIDNIVLQTSGRQLERLSRFQMLARYSSLPASKKLAVQQSLRFAQIPDDNVAYKVIMWLPFYFFREMEKYHYNTSFNEPLRLDITLSGCKILQTADLSGGATELTAHAPTEVECIAQYRQLDARDEDALINAQYGDGLLSQCVSMMKEEAVHTIAAADVSAGSNNVKIDLKENLCVSKVYVVITAPNPVADATYAQTLNANDVPLEITNIKLTASGVSVVDCHGDLIKYFGKWGEHDSANVSSGNGERAFEHVYCIDFTTTHKGHTNTIAFRELSNPRLELDFKARTASKAHEVRVMYETTTFLSTSSATGRVQLSISS